MARADGRDDTLAWNAATARFVLICIGVWLHSADTLVTATIAPAIVEDLGGIAYINWTLSIYEVGAIIAGSAPRMQPIPAPARTTTSEIGSDWRAP